MNNINKHRFIITIITLACSGLAIEGMIEDWEFWVNPLLILGVVILWVLHIGQRTEERFRELFYLSFCMFSSFYHGMHATSFFDVATVSLLMLIMFSLLDRVMVLNVIMVEYVVIMVIQVAILRTESAVVLDGLNISRLALQIASVLAAYAFGRMSIKSRIETMELLKKRDEDIKAYDDNMEDFLANISHELRTPVNVVNGMSQILRKQGEKKELDAIRDAGLRLSKQIEDIQDYTEINRNGMVMEKENYTITSLINDAVVWLRRYGREDLELIIDLAPSVPSIMNGDARMLSKILRHLTDNAVKFTKVGGIYVKIYATKKEYGVNLNIEVTDTGIGMHRRDIALASSGMHQANKKRNRSTGGIGLGLSLVYGMVHGMGGFVKIESEIGKGTTVRITVPQEVVNWSSCLKLTLGNTKDVIFYVETGRYKVPEVRDFYKTMATNLAGGLRQQLYSAGSIKEVMHLMEKLEVSHIFMGEEEYAENTDYFEKLAREGMTIAVSARSDYLVRPESNVLIMPKPLYGYHVVKVLNGQSLEDDKVTMDERGKLEFRNVRALVVDDEPMNLVVATGLLQEYRMKTDTAESGREAVEKLETTDYDIVFLDHMMPEMDGVETLKRLRDVTKQLGKNVIVIALTANAVSGAREMFLKEGFDGFIAKPIDISEFEHVMKKVLPKSRINFEGGDGV